MLEVQKIQALLEEGEKIDIQDYYDKCRVHYAKAFYFFCLRLSQNRSNTSTPSSDIREFILTQVKSSRITIDKMFNPEGWFAYDWTDEVEGHDSKFFRKEYLEILFRSEDTPYKYKIKSEYFDVVRSLIHNNETPIAFDLSLPEPAPRMKVDVYRILRDTALARRIKQLHNFECQICGVSLDLGNGGKYAESHHLKPLGKPHFGPDIEENIFCVCPNHHALLDYGAITIDRNNLIGLNIHNLADEYLEYHNQQICAEDKIW